jgi:murein DD-endopeptidase MepM/ murein hydrolase activator NlpD
MEDTKIAVKPKQPKLVPRVSNIETLQKSSDKIKTSSNKLKRIFEKNSYQKKTQLSILRRYKRRLDSIEREDEERRKKASKRKVKLPDIKKFAGSFFAPGASSDPLKAVGALAAFNSLEKLANGDVLGSIAPGLVAAGMVAGPGLIGAGVNKFFDRGKTPKGFDVSGRRVSKSTQQRYLNRYGEKAFKNRFGKQNLKNINTTTGVVSTGGRATKAFGRLGKSIIPGVGAVLGAVDAKLRADEGDITGSRIAGASAALDAATAASAATGIGLIATPFLGLASITLDLVNFARDITGMSEAESKKNITTKGRLKEQTKKQKELVDKKEESKTGLSFGKTLVGYERVMNKFEEFSKNFKLTTEGQFDEPPMPAPTRVAPGSGYTGPISGDTFFPLPGGDVGTQGNVSSVQAFGGYREGRPEGHQGLDMTHWKGALDAPVSAYKTGKVVAAVSNGYNGFVEIDHGGGLRTLYYHTIPMVSVGDEVYGGQQIAKLYPAGDNTHLHFGISNNGTYENPLPHVRSVKNKIPSPLTKERAKKQHDSSSQTTRPASASVAIPPSPQPPSPQPRPAAAKPRPAAAQPKPQPRPAVKPQRVVIGGHTYEYKNGKYYQNGEEISKDLYDAVKRNHPYSFSSTQKPKDYSIAHNMPYNNPGNTFLISYNQPAPQSPQPQPASQSGVLIIKELNTIKDLTMLALG